MRHIRLLLFRRFSSGRVSSYWTHLAGLSLAGADSRVRHLMNFTDHDTHAFLEFFFFYVFFLSLSGIRLFVFPSSDSGTLDFGG